MRKPFDLSASAGPSLIALMQPAELHVYSWNGQLGYHPRIHLLIIGGGITPDGQHLERGWVSAACWDSSR
jgi:hypothetical protein